MRTVNTYHTFFSDRSLGKSSQRDLQQTIEEPIKLSWARGSDHIDNEVKRAKIQMPDFDGNLKIVLFPVARNKILVRMVNLADLFDGEPSEAPQFDLEGWAKHLYATVNPGADSVNVAIVERNLSNSMDYSEMFESRLHWRTRDGEPEDIFPADRTPNAVFALEPQRIRVFSVTFSE